MNRASRLFPMAVLAASAVAAIFRIAQLLAVVDYDTMGFFDSAAPFGLTWGIYVFFGIAAIVFIAGILLDKKMGADSYSCKAAEISPKYTLRMGIAFGVGFCLQFIQMFAGSDRTGLAFIGEAVTMAAYLAAAFMLLARKGIKPSVGYIQLIISISYTIKSAALFMQDTIIVRVSDELILLLSYVASVLFFLALGRFISGNETKNTRIKLMFTAGATAVLSLCASFSGWFAYLVDLKYFADKMNNHPLPEMAAAAIALAVIFALYGEKKELDSEQEDTRQPDGEIEEKSENAAQQG
ncbi:MAG: hypothetical protein NC228_09125 [[Eubacterium] siraeum]|nr:hypothetical protein [[Eubacterium] siraeum]